MLWKYCGRSIFFFNSSPDFSNHYLILFFSSHFRQCHCHNWKKKKFIPLFRQWHCHNSFVNFIFFSFSLRALHAHPGSRIGHRKFGIPVAEIQHFLSPPFSSSLSYLWLNFDNSNTEIQSLSSKSQISLNSSYNAN